jgi:hypothetical protein
MAKSESAEFMLMQVQWNLDSLFSSGVWKRNDGSGKTIHAGTIYRGFTVVCVPPAGLTEWYAAGSQISPVYTQVRKNCKRIYIMLEVLTMQVPVIWDVTPCSLVDIKQCFGGICYLHRQGKRCVSLKWQYTPTWVNSHNPDDSDLWIIIEFSNVFCACQLIKISYNPKVLHHHHICIW